MFQVCVRQVCVSLALLSFIFHDCESRPNVLLIGIDGFGAEYMKNYTSHLPNIASVINDGVFSFAGRNFQPSFSAPNWASILTGQPPQQSGILSNSWEPSWPLTETITDPCLPPYEYTSVQNGIVPNTLFILARRVDSSLKTAAAVSWSWLTNLLNDGPHTEVDSFFDGHDNDTATAEALCGFIEKDQPNLMFIHFDSVDEAGHHYGWGSDEYYYAARNVDNLIGELFQCLSENSMRENTQVMITADHGGYKTTHCCGSDWYNEATMFIPVLMSGPGLKSNGVNLTEEYPWLLFQHDDWTPTILHSLGIDYRNISGSDLRGRVCEACFA